MAPPNLAADAPVLNVLQPLRVNLLPMHGKKPNEMIAHDSERFFGFRITQKPLLAQARLDRDFAPLAEADVVFIRLGFREQSLLLQHLRRFLARLEPIESIQLRYR